jgi:hypothetical protein
MDQKYQFDLWFETMDSTYEQVGFKFFVKFFLFFRYINQQICKRLGQVLRIKYFCQILWGKDQI